MSNITELQSRIISVVRPSDGVHLEGPAVPFDLIGASTEQSYTLIGETHCLNNGSPLYIRWQCNAADRAFTSKDGGPQIELRSTPDCEEEDTAVLRLATQYCKGHPFWLESAQSAVDALIDRGVF